MADLSSILGGMVQGFKDFGTGLVDFFGTGAANIGDIASSIATGRATTKNQDDFRKWLYQTDDAQDAAAKGLGTILNGVSTVADVMPGAQAVTANPLFNGLQGAIGGVSDELKMAGKDADWGRAAQRAGVGAASGLASAYAGQALGKTGNKLLSNGLTRGAVSGALGGGIANAGYTGIEGGSVQDMINAGLYGAQTGALVGGTTGLARELIKPAHKMDVAFTDEEKAARIADIDDQLGKLDTSTPEGNARYAELTAARENYEPKTYYHGSPETDITEFDINRAGKNTRSGEKAIYFTDTPEAAEEFAYERIPTDSIFMDKVGKRGGVYEANLDMRNTLDLDNLTDAQIKELWPYASYMGSWQGEDVFARDIKHWRDVKNPQLIKGYLDLEKLANSPYDSISATMYPNTGNNAKEYAIFDATKAKITKSPKNVADLMLDADSGAVNITTPLEQAKAAADSATETFLNKSGRMASDGEINSTFEEAFIKNAKALGASDIEINNELNRLFKTYDVNYTHRNKTVADLMLSPDDDVMASKNIGGSSEPTEAKGAATRVGSKNVAQVDLNTLPESMKAAKSYLNKDYIKDIESYSGKKIGDMTDAELMEYALKDKPAETRDIYRVGIEDIVKGGKTMRQVAENYAANRYLRELADKNFDDIDSKALVSYLLNNAHRLNDSKTRAADIELSDRLGIGQSNTFMDDYRVPYDAQGVFDVADSTISIRPELSQESAVNTVAHERLHSFQTENDIKRYDKRVLNAYDDLAKELKPLLKTPEETAKRYRFDADYWGNEREQQSRMLQQYLENKGYTKGGLQEANVGEWGNEINPAFDKFFDKLRALSKKGVALPALSALFGGGAIMAATQGDDKKKKSEVK